MRIKLRAAIQQASQEKTRVVIPGGRIVEHGQPATFSIAVQSIRSEGEDLLLVCL